jgi:hypothetical protein|tara:strand:- start:312 stop:890 length:579 start_codon:yes stop_codon:yes gene_type:complete
MARTLTTAFNNAITSQVIRPLLACELEFSTGTLRFWNGYGDLTMTAGGSSNTFTGLGDLMNVSAISESDQVEAVGAQLSLTGIKSSLISAALSANYTNRNASIFLGLFDTNKAVIADVYTLFKGKMDIMKIDEGPETATIALNLENRLIVLDRAKERRYTHEDQQLSFAGDLGFEFVPDLQDKEIIWGKKTS